MASISITSVNYNGQTAEITFYSVNDPTTPVNLGSHTIPYSRSDVVTGFTLNSFDFCPAGMYDGVSYYVPTDGPNRVMFREGSYWYIAANTVPGTSNFVVNPDDFVESNSFPPPLTGWNNGSILVSTNCGGTIDIYGTYELNFPAYSKICIVNLAVPTTTTTTTTTTTAAPGGVAGYIVSGASNGLYNGTYCLYPVNEGPPIVVYKHQTNNIYIYFGSGFTWIGPIVGNITSSTIGFFMDDNSDGYFVAGESEPLPSGGWSEYSCCGTPLGGTISVTATTCGATTTTTTTTTAAPDAFASSVVTYLRMNGANGSQSFADSGPSPKTATSSGGAQITTSQKKYGTGSAGGFGAITVSGGAPNLSGDFTIDFWAYTSGWNNEGVVFSIPRGSSTLNLISDNRNFVGFGLQFAGAFATYPPANQWVHIACVKQGSTTRLYYDGVQVATELVSAGYYGDFVSDGDLIIGQLSWKIFNGYIDDFRVTNACRYPDGTTFTPPSELPETTTTTTAAPSANGLLISGSLGQDGTFCPVATLYERPFYKHTATNDWFIWYDGMDWYYGDKIGGTYDPANPTSILANLRALALALTSSPTAPLTGWSSDLENATITQTTCVG